MRRSLVYQSHWLYEGAMALLYGRNYRRRHSAIAALIPPNTSVLDVCCGPGTLYSRHLKGRCSSYLGIDINERFIAQVRRRGADGMMGDVAEMPALPVRDYCVMQASLYQFLPTADSIINKLLNSARQSVIVAEPVRNLADSPNRILRWAGRAMTNPGRGACPTRFNSDTLARFFERYGDLVLHKGCIAGGREDIYMLRGHAK